VQTVPKSMFESVEDLAVGSQLRATTDDGEQTVIVIDVTDDEITVDGNHPLAGIDLKFDVEILEVRDATEDELKHGHVHGEGGCGHSHD
jgi:FKBP-type peptidyl-prolyl cis-trans isomerase SlyD